MKKIRIISTILCVFCLSFYCFSISSKAVEFTDVSFSDWFYHDVEYLTHRGIISGYPDGRFLPQNNITRAEFIALVTRMSGYEIMGGVHFSDTLIDFRGNSLWHSDYISTALKNNIIYKDEYENIFFPDDYITRKDAAIFVFRALELPMIPFVSPYADISNNYTTALFAECIMQGTDNGDSTVNFYPTSYLSRAEASAVIGRAIAYRENKTGYIDDFEKAHGKRRISLMISPESEEEFINLCVYAVKNRLTELNFSYPTYGFYSSVNNIIQTNFLTAYEKVSAAYPEYFSLISATYTKTGTELKTDVSVKFKGTMEALPLEKVYMNLNLSEQKAKAIADTILQGYTTDGEKLMAIHDFLVLNTAFLDDANFPERYTAYGVFYNNMAVCQGYSAAFNLISRAAGLKSISVQNDIHAWNLALVDGKSLHFDTTWDDPVPNRAGMVLRNYRGISEKKLSESRNWNKNLYSPTFFDGVVF